MIEQSRDSGQRNSKVYESADTIRLCKAAGLKLVTVRDGIGYCHSLLRFCLDRA